jgi:hypothetical protein
MWWETVKVWCESNASTCLDKMENTGKHWWELSVSWSTIQSGIFSIKYRNLALEPTCSLRQNVRIWTEVLVTYYPPFRFEKWWKAMVDKSPNTLNFVKDLRLSKVTQARYRHTGFLSTHTWFWSICCPSYRERKIYACFNFYRLFCT